MYNFDVAIIGSGLVGSCLAIGLKKSNLNIVILDKYSIDNNSYEKKIDPRPLSITFGSKKVLNMWGIWKDIKGHASKIQYIHISEENKPFFVNIFAEQHKIPDLGYVVPFDLLQKIIHSKVLRQSNTTFIKVDKVLQIFNNRGFSSILCVVNGKKKFISSKILIGSDGSDSVCRQLIGSKSKKINKGDVAIICTLHCKFSHKNIAYQRFTKEGILAILPLFDKNKRRLVWSMKQEIYKELSCSDKIEFNKVINEIFSKEIGPILEVSKNAEFPLISSITENFSSYRSILIGNSAHTIYPITAQGFNLGLQDAKSLSSILTDLSIEFNSEVPYIGK